MGVPPLPILPVADVRLTVLAVSVKAPLLVMVPDPFALTLIVPRAPAEMLPSMVIGALPALVVKDIVLELDTEIPAVALRVLPDVMDMLPVALDIVP